MNTTAAKPDPSRHVRVLYSFPHRLGAERICTTAWHQVSGLAQAGARVTVFPNSVKRALPDGITVRPTLAIGSLRMPFRLLGSRRAFWLHDQIVARRLQSMAGQVDIVHLWPSGSLQTLRVAKRLGIPTVLERPNAHTRFAYEAVQRECDRLGVALPADHEHAYNEQVLAKEEAEYLLATRLLCPSDFVADTFMAQGFPPEILARHQYGFDDGVFFPSIPAKRESQGLTILFAGGCAPRKGLHFALEAWLQSSACHDGTFLIAGGFVPSYREKLSVLLNHPSVQVLGHRTDIPALMRRSDVLILPSIEEGSALVTSEARGSGCVLLVSEAAGAACCHMTDGLIHPVGSVSTLTQHINMLHDCPGLLNGLRKASLKGVAGITWQVAGKVLLDVYRQVIASYAQRQTALTQPKGLTPDDRMDWIRSSNVGQEKP